MVGVSAGKEIAFWGESGRMKLHKAVDLMQRYPDGKDIFVLGLDPLFFTHVLKPILFTSDGG